MTSQQPVPPILVHWILWVALLFSLVVYGLIPLLVILPAGQAPGPAELFVSVFALATLATVVGTAVARHVALVGPIRRRQLDPTTPAGSMRLWQVSLILWVLSESVGIYGLVLFFLFGEALYLYPFLLVAACLMVYHRPGTAGLRPPASAADLAREDVKIG